MTKKYAIFKEQPGKSPNVKIKRFKKLIWFKKIWYFQESITFLKIVTISRKIQKSTSTIFQPTQRELVLKKSGGGDQG